MLTVVEHDVVDQYPARAPTQRARRFEQGNGVAGVGQFDGRA